MLIYIYNCYGGTHSSALAAAYHLKKLPFSRKPSKNEILSTDCFNQLSPKEMGKLIFHGLDEEGHQVYTIGRGSSKAVIPAMLGVLSCLKKTENCRKKSFFKHVSDCAHCDDIRRFIFKKAENRSDRGSFAGARSAAGIQRHHQTGAANKRPFKNDFFGDRSAG